MKNTNLEKNKTKLSQEAPLCNICKSNEYTVFYLKATTWEHEGRFRIVKCKKCGLVYLNPRPVRAVIGEFYPKKSYWGRDVNKTSNKFNISKERKYSFEPIYKTILREYSSGSILDIGAGTGIFLSYFKDLGWSVFGVELSKEAALFSKKYFNIPLKIGDFLDFKYNDKVYDVVTLNNALEHLYDPSATLKNIHKIMKPGGAVLITVPNIESLGSKIFKSKWHAIQPPRHLYHFSETTLKILLEKNGFEPVKINRWIWSHNYYTIFESFRFNSSPRFKKKVIGGLSQPFYEKKFSLKIEIGKVLVKILSVVIVCIGSLFNRSEIIAIYAKKRN